MANTQRLQQEYENQRQGQIALRAAFLVQFIRTWGLLRLDNLDGSFPAWSETSMREISDFREASFNLGLRGYAETRLTAAPKALTTPIPQIPEVDWRQHDVAGRLALKITGPQEIKTQIAKGVTPEAARDRALVTSSGSATRQILAGGRTAVLTAVETDPAASGWARVGDAAPCSFCAMLIGRGPAYKTEQSAGFQAHDHCACVPVAVFSKTAAWPAGSREIRAFYDEATAEFSGTDKIRAFRRAWEASQRGARKVERVASSA